MSSANAFQAIPTIIKNSPITKETESANQEGPNVRISLKNKIKGLRDDELITNIVLLFMNLSKPSDKGNEIIDSVTKGINKAIIDSITDGISKVIIDSIDKKLKNQKQLCLTEDNKKAINDSINKTVTDSNTKGIVNSITEEIKKQKKHSITEDDKNAIIDSITEDDKKEIIDSINKTVTDSNTKGIIDSITDYIPKDININDSIRKGINNAFNKPVIYIIPQDDFVDIFYILLCHEDKSVSSEVSTSNEKHDYFKEFIDKYQEWKNPTSDAKKESDQPDRSSRNQGSAGKTVINTTPLKGPSADSDGSSTGSRSNSKGNQTGVNQDKPSPDITSTHDSATPNPDIISELKTFSSHLTKIENSLSDIHTALDAISSKQAALSERFTNSSRENAEYLKRIKGTVLKIAEKVDKLPVPQDNETILPEDSETIRKIRKLTIQMVDCLAFAAQNSNNPTNNKTTEEIK